MTAKSVVILSLLLAPVFALKAELPSAAELLAQLEQLSAQTNTSEAVTSTPLSEAFLRYMKTPYGADTDPAAWLNLLDLLMASDDKRLLILPQERSYCLQDRIPLNYEEEKTDAFTYLLLRLPPASCWPAIREGLGERSAAFASTNIPPVLTSLQFVFDTLDHDTTSASNRLASLSRVAQRDAKTKKAFRNFERALKSKRPPSHSLVPFILATRYSADARDIGWISFPNELLTLPDEKLWDYAAPALTNRNIKLNPYVSEPLASRLAKLSLDHLDVLEEQAFCLFKPTDDGFRLFNALSEKFNILPRIAKAYAATTNGVASVKGEDDLTEELEEFDLEKAQDLTETSRRMAAQNELERLLSGKPFVPAVIAFLEKGDLTAAKALSAQLPPHALNYTYATFPANAAAMDFIETDILPHNAGNILNTYAKVAIGSRQTERALAKIAELKKSAPKDIDAYLLAQFKIYNAMDLPMPMEESLPLLLRQINEYKKGKSKYGRSDIVTAAELAIGFFRAETNLTAIAQIADALVKNDGLDYSDRCVCACAKILNGGKQSDKALELLLAHLERDGDDPPSLADEVIETLLTIYASNGRHQDIVDFIENFPSARYKTPLELLEVSSDTYPLYARALKETGRKDEAARLASFQLTLHPVCGEDWPYESLVDTWPADRFIALMDSFSAMNRFEERPLIWKAECLRRAGRLEEAESIARKAVETDPTDGETEAGDRVRSYAVLAQILAERGNAKDAEFFGNVVKAVRIAEEGDVLSDDGLLSRGMAKYAEAEKYFSAAYCVQWRIAERMRALGLDDLADAHYEESFRQMPAQFGYVASLCLGCNGIFDNPKSVSAAEKILTRIAAGDAPHPTACYLLGKLREEQNRNEEACEAFAKACALAPDYLDALNALLITQASLNMPREVLEATQSRILALDPRGDQSYILPTVVDWGLVERARGPVLAAIPIPQPGTDDVPDWVFPGAAKASEKQEPENVHPDPLLVWTLEKTWRFRMTNDCAWFQSLAALLRILQPELSYLAKDDENYCFAPSAAGFGDYDYSELDDFLF